MAKTKMVTQENLRKQCYDSAVACAECGDTELAILFLEELDKLGGLAKNFWKKPVFKVLHSERKFRMLAQMYL